MYVFTSLATPVKFSFVTSLSSLVQLDPPPSLLYLTSDMQSKSHNKLHSYVFAHDTLPSIQPPPTPTPTSQRHGDNANDTTLVVLTGFARILLLDK